MENSPNSVITEEELLLLYSYLNTEWDDYTEAERESWTTVLLELEKLIENERD